VTSANLETPREGHPEDIRRGIEGAPEDHRSPEPLPEPAPEPAPAPEPRERKSPPRSRPTREEVREFWKTGSPENSPLHGDPDAFFDHHETYGWRGKKGPIQDWRAAARTWDRLEPTFTSRSGARPSASLGRPVRSSSRSPGEWDLAGEEPLAETAPRGKPQ
jgi:hypothetical protein